MCRARSTVAIFRRPRQVPCPRPDLVAPRAAGIVEGGEDGYALTRDGQRLLEALAPLDGWAKRWARRTGTSTLGA